MRRLMCGFGWGESKVEQAPALRAIQDRWCNMDSSGAIPDRQAAEIAIEQIFERMELPAPQVCWWSSPVSMLLAHEVQCLGEGGARALYGDAVFEESPEFAAWQREVRASPLGRPIGLRVCACSKGGGRAQASDCPRHSVLIKRAVLASRWEEASTLASTINPLPQSRHVDALARASFNCGMEHHYFAEQDLDRIRDRPVFGPEVSVWAGQEVWSIAKMQLLEALTGADWSDSCLRPFQALAENTSVAIMRERQCWLSGRATYVGISDRGNIHGSRAPAAVFADGSALYANEGAILPRSFVERPEGLDVDAIDAQDAQPIRRESLIRLYGVKRYLANRNALVEAAVGSTTLWSYRAGRLGQRHMLEIYEDSRLGSGPGFTYYELPETVLSLEEAIRFAGNPDDVIRLVIEA